MMGLDWNAWVAFIDPELYVVVVCCWIIGTVLKQTPFIPDWTIVYLVTIVSILLTAFTIGWSAQAVIQGILCGAAAVYGHQLYKQSWEGVSRYAARNKK